MLNLLIDGWYDLHKSEAVKNNVLTQIDKLNIECEKDERLPHCWNISYANFISMLMPETYMDDLFFNKSVAKERITAKGKDTVVDCGTDIYRKEYYLKHFLTEFRIFEPNVVSEKYKEEMKENIRKYVQLAHNISTKVGEIQSIEIIKKRMIYLLKSTESYDKRLCEELIIIFDKLRAQDFEGWTNAIYYYIYFAITSRLHTDVGYSRYEKLEQDLKEYREEVVMGYGSCGTPGMSKIYSMATRNDPNIIALFELGEMEYYGQGPSGRVNFESALKCYKEIMKKNSYHPLAAWSIAYMLFYYKKPGKELENATISDFDKYYWNEDGTRNDNWYIAIEYYVDKAYSFGCAAAANLIGLIIDEDDRALVSNWKYAGHDSSRYYKESADANYVFGCNNYASRCIKKASEVSNFADQSYWAMEGRKYLEKSAHNGNYWALNKLGRYHYEGIKIPNTDIDIFECDKDKSYQYFLKARKVSGREKEYWPLINLIEKFWLADDAEDWKEVAPTKQNLLIEIQIALSNLKDHEQKRKLKKIKKEIEGVL